MRFNYPWTISFSRSDHFIHGRLIHGQPQGIAHTGIPSMVFFATIMNYESNKFFYYFFILKLKF